MEVKRLTCLLSIVLLLLLLPPPLAFSYETKAIDKLQSIDKIELSSVSGPESLAFDNFGEGPYTGVSNGKVLKWQGKDVGWAEFAFNSRHRNAECGVYNNVLFESRCGRPLGLRFHNKTGDLYVADAYFGLFKVGPNGGLMSELASGAEGVPFTFTNGLDIDQETGVVYFTDSSMHFPRSENALVVISGDATGRLMKYDPQTEKVTVLKKNLVYPNGVAISDDNTYLLVAESTPCRILKYWLQGPKTGQLEHFADLPGYPDNIKRNSRGEFWVAMGKKAQPNGLTSRSALDNPVALRLSKEGKVLEILDGDISLSEVQERDGTLWFGSVEMSYIGVYKA
ncbi:protein STRICTOSIDINE SYNTHASE-LIKE 10-like [Typha angustifolia]|uniref:protein STRICTOSIDINE SYNTHASE-LIKE 10-like n=1 Tax=Typha angustifolia TaxID=59011 RepID=UPI003C2BBD5F